MLTFRRATILFFLLLAAVNIVSLLPENPVTDLIRSFRLPITFSLAAGYLGLSFGMAFLPCTGYHFPTICKGITNENKVAITFDDGPDPVCTPKVLDVLKSRGIPATFFCIGSKIKNNEAIVQRIVSENHLLGNHSFSHSFLFDWFPARKVLREIEETDHLIRQATGLKPAWFRPPFGVLNPMVSNALKKCGHQSVCWDIRSLDTMGGSPERIIVRILKKIKPGSVILLHEHSRFSQNNLDQLLDGIETAGFAVAPLNQIIESKAYV